MDVVKELLREHLQASKERIAEIESHLLGESVVITGGHYSQENLVGRTAVIDDVHIENSGITVHLDKISRRDGKSGFLEKATYEGEYFRLRHVEFNDE